MKKVERNDLLNGWLRYHSTTVEEVIAKHPKEVLESVEWFKLYLVTQEQHDQWVIWAKDYIKKVTKLSKETIERSWWLVYLDCSPSVKDKL